MPNLRVLYVFNSYSPKGSSVQTKVLSQIRYLNETGVSCRGAFFTTATKELVSLNEFVQLIPYKAAQQKYFSNSGSRKNLDDAIEKHLEKVVGEFDVFYIRYPLASKRLFRIVRRFGKKIVFEHQAKEIPEIISLLRNERFRPKLGYLLYLSEYGLKRVSGEWYYGKRIFKRLRMGIAVTSEVAKYENTRENSYRCEVVGNGIELEKYPVVRENRFNGKDLNLFMLIGANTSSPTHGVDRLIRSVRNHRSKFNICVSIFSKNVHESERGANYEIKYEGFLSQEQLNSRLEGMHFAVGGLTSFRKNVLFGSALKVREYFSRGFPIIMASIDEDIERDEEARKYVIQVPNVEADLDFKSLEAKIEKILVVSERATVIRAAAQRLFSFSAKMNELAQKIELIVNSRQ